MLSPKRVRRLRLCRNRSSPDRLQHGIIRGKDSGNMSNRPAPSPGGRRAYPQSATRAASSGRSAMRIFAAPAPVSTSAIRADRQRWTGPASAASRTPAPRAASTKASALRREKCSDAVDPGRQGIGGVARQVSRGNRAIDQRGLHGEILRPQQRRRDRPNVLRRRDKGAAPRGVMRAVTRRGKIIHIAVGGSDIGEAELAHGVGGMTAHGEDRRWRVIRRAAVRSDRAHGIGAGHQDRRPGSAAEFGIGERFDASSGAMIDRVTSARSAAAVRSASGSGRVTRMRTLNPARRSPRRRGP